jgi:chemotaxis signal transduction protein
MERDLSHNHLEEGNPTRELRVVLAGSHRLGIFADQIESISEWRQPTPLPRAPRAVLGVVSIHGRMLTVLDPLALFADSGGKKSLTSGLLVALNGDEQLALAVDRLGKTLEIAAQIEPGVLNDHQRLAMGVVLSGNEEIIILDVNKLFAAAIEGHERRRREF